MRPDADHAQHAPCVALRRAMGEEQILLATGAAAKQMNRLWFEAGGEQLAAIGFDQIKVQAGANGRVTGGTLREKQHGVFGAYGIAVVDLVKKVARVSELRLKVGEQVFAHCVTACADAGADGGNKIFRA